MIAPCRLTPGESRPGSWIISDRTGRAVIETFNPQVAAAIDAERYTVWTAWAWLADINRRIKEGTHAAR